MAKTKEAEEEIAGLGIDAESLEMLESEVKKGKARKFILICKGAQIKKLIVFKKGPYHTRIQKAKSEGFKGDAICGIVTGSGVNLSFQLAGNKEVADAMSVDSVVDGEPTKITKLKEFLADNNLTRKPAYDIVRDVSALAKTGTDEEEAVATVSGEGPASPAMQTAQATAAEGKDDFQAKCQQLKAVLVPKIKEALTADPERKDEIKQLLETAASHEKQQQFGDAFKAFKTLAETVKGALGGVNDKDKYDAALPGAELKIKTLQDHPQKAAFKPEFDKLAEHLQKAKTCAGKGKYADANKELAKLEKEYPAVKELADKIHEQRKYESGLRIRFNNLKLHQGISAINQSKIKKLEDRFPELDAAIKDRRWTDVDDIWFDISGKIDAFKQLANRHGDYVGLRNNSLLLVEALKTHPNKDAIDKEIKSIRKDLIDKAKEEYETNSDYEEARRLLALVEEEYAKARKKADEAAQTAFTKEYNAAQSKLDTLAKSEKGKTVPEEIQEMKSNLARAQTYAGVTQYREALALVAEVVKECAAAEQRAAQQLAFDAAEKAAAEATGKIDKDAKTAIAAVQKLHDDLTKHPQVTVIQSELGEIQKKINGAKAAVA